MTDKKTHAKIRILSAVLLIIFFGIKIFGPKVIHQFYHNDNIEILNFISGSHVPQTLDYYAGKVEDNLFGPAKSIASGLLLLILSLTYLRNGSALFFGFAVFAYFFLSRFEVLFYPPYGEVVVPLVPAVWLVQNSFDYIGLLNEKSFVEGGPRTYYTSIYPSFVAVMMYLMPTVKSFIVAIHLITFAFAAAIIAASRELFLAILNKLNLTKAADNGFHDFNAKIAVIGAVLVLSLPVFQSLSEQFYMSMANTAFAVLAVYFIFRRNIVLASVMAVMSLLVKAPGAIACSAVFLASLMLFFIEPQRKGRVRDVLFGFGAVLLAVVKFLVRSSLMGDQPSHNKVSLLAGWPYMKGMLLTWFFLAFLLVFLWQCALWLQNQRKQARLFRLFLQTHFEIIFMFLMALQWFLLYINFSVMGYRYQILLFPFYIFALLFAVIVILRKRQWIQWSLIAGFIFSCLCSHGLLHDRSQKSSIYSYHDFERSLEYRNDLKLHMKLADEIQNNYSQHKIGAPWVVAQKLAIREFGYVDKPLDVMIYGMSISYGGIENFSGLHNVDIDKTLWVGFEKNHISEDIEYPIGPQDKIVQKLAVGNKEILLFTGGFAIDRLWKIIELHIRGYI